MAQATKTTITINGKPITKFSSFSLSQGIFDHHFFRLACPAEAIDGKTGIVFSQSKTWMGKPFIIEINPQDDSSSAEGFVFNGVVTQIQTERFGGSVGQVVISGYSPTIMLESGPHCKTWEKKAVKNIVQDVLKHFPQDALKSKVNPTYPETLSYYVQYKETAWQFLRRICSSYGEWLLYNGESLVIGPLSGSAKQLEFGKNIDRFTMSLEVAPPSRKVMAYDYLNNEVLSTSPTGIPGQAGLSSRGVDAHNASLELYGTEPKVWNNTFLTNKKQLDKQVNIQSAMLSCNHERFTGSSGYLGITVGSKVSVTGVNVTDKSKEDYGTYSIISINHYAGENGEYRNDFIAVPDSIKLPPVAIVPDPDCETQSAIVTDNNDPLHLGRVRARFHWMKPSEKTPWIRVTSPHGGGDKGMYFIPEIDEEAIICFEGNSAVKPFVNGMVYHGKAKTSFANAGNDVKALQTRSGNKMVMNDKDGSVFMEDKDGNSMMYDGAGNITVKANKMITLSCGASTIVMKEDGTIDITGKDVTIVGSASVTAASGSEASNSGVTIDPSNIGVSAKTAVNIGSGTETNIQSATTTVSGTGTMNVTGGVVNVN
jgi:type VI secretion system secreted protein VgrG